MAIFNMMIECGDEDEAGRLLKYIEGIELYQDGLEQNEVFLYLVTKQGMLDCVSDYADANNVRIEVAAWPEDSDYEEAVKDGEMDIFNY